MVNTILFVVMQLTHMSSDFSELMPFTNRTVLRKSPSEFDNASLNIRHFCRRHSAVEYFFDPMSYLCLAQIPRYSGMMQCREAAMLGFIDVYGSENAVVIQSSRIKRTVDIDTFLWALSMRYRKSLIPHTISTCTKSKRCEANPRDEIRTCIVLIRNLAVE